MDSANEDEFIKRIERFVIDEGQVATYKWVSRSMEIHVNQAKQLLRTFMNTRAKDYEESISANHLVSGKHIDGSQSVVIVNDSELERTKSSFIDVLSEHVYSVQNTKSLADYEVLYAVDTFETTSSVKNSPISCSLSVPRENVKTAPPPAAAEVKKPLAAKDSSNKVKETVAKPAVKKEEVKETKAVVKSENVKVEKPGTQKKNAISSMFSAQQKKAQNAPKKVEESKEPENIEPPVAENPVEVKAKKENTPKASKKIPQKRAPKKVQEEKPEQKRKRIRVLSDSEDSDQDNERVPSPEPEPEPSVTVVSDDEDVASKNTPSDEVGHKKKKRKLVEKQEVDEQGYMQTTKEYVFETDSEPDTEPSKPAPSVKKTPPAEKAKPAAAKKSASPKKGKGKAASDGRKQSSLLSFFKKT